MNALKLVGTDSLQNRAIEARARIETLERAAQAADKAAVAAQDAFERTPTAQTVVDREVSKQLAVKAHEDATLFSESVAALLQEADREAKRGELATLSAQLSTSEFDRHRERLNEIFASTRRNMRGALTEMLEAVVRSNGLRARARNLAEGLGLPPSDYPSVVFESLLEAFAPLSPYGQTKTFSLICFTPNFQETERRWRLEFNELLNGGDK